MFNHLFKTKEGLECMSLENEHFKQVNATGCGLKALCFILLPLPGPSCNRF